MISLIVQLVLKQLSPTLLRVITVLRIQLRLYTKVYVVCGFPGRISKDKDKKRMESPCLDIEGLNKQQARIQALLIRDKKTRMVRIFNVWHNQRIMSKRKQILVLLPSEISMNIQWITLHNKYIVSSNGIYYLDEFPMIVLCYGMNHQYKRLILDLEFVVLLLLSKHWIHFSCVKHHFF